MPRFLSPDWVAAFNDALEGVEVPPSATEGSITASSGDFSVAQLVHDVPSVDNGGVTDVGTRLEVSDRGLVLSSFDPSSHDLEAVANVTVSLSYDDAAALSRGELQAAELLGTGRVRVRGDLSVLVAGQSALAAAAEQLSALQATTTY